MDPFGRDERFGDPIRIERVTSLLVTHSRTPIGWPPEGKVPVQRVRAGQAGRAPTTRAGGRPTPANPPPAAAVSCDCG
jgi:hypothetical protein